METFVDELAKMCDGSKDNFIFLEQDGRPRKRAREIGEKIYLERSSSGLFEVCHLLEERISSRKNRSIALRELDVCWNGIGDWQA